MTSVFTTAALMDATMALDFPKITDPDFETKVEAYGVERDALVEKWKVTLHNAYFNGFSDSAAELVYAQAYRDSNSSGWVGIENRYIVLAELIKDVQGTL